MPVYTIATTVEVEADTREEAIEIANASMPSSGAVRIGGTVGTVTRVSTAEYANIITRSGTGMDRPALVIDADYVRDEVWDSDGPWTTEAAQCISQMTDRQVNAEMAGAFGDHFWAAMDVCREETIDYLLDWAKFPNDKRRKDTT